MPQFTAPRPQLTVTLRKPRNPLVASSLMRQAGRHGQGAQRQQAKSALLKEIRQLVPIERSP
jgi:hypothetical protein